jgi:LPPG:FO 2-phospho-L-lactate transferase
VGLARVLGPDELTAVVNTGDDASVYGLHVSPDVDIVTYWLAGVADTARGWGLDGDTFTVVDALGELGGPSWFRLGDRDMATCLYRTQRLASGLTLSAVTDDIRRALGVSPRILPMSDDPVRTMINCSDGRTLEFQEWFVKERCEPDVDGVDFAGLADAKPGPSVLDAIETADVVVVCPSNPIVSIGPIVALPGVVEALAAHRSVIAVSPLVNGVPLKGPADKLLAASGDDVSAAGVASRYSNWCNTFVIDETDATVAGAIEVLGLRCLKIDTIMTDHDASARLARALLDARLRSRSGASPECPKSVPVTTSPSSSSKRVQKNWWTKTSS